MLKNGFKHKFVLVKKTPTNGSIYPSLNQKLNSSYKSFLNPNSSYSINNRKKLNRTSSAFLDRNYDSYIKKIIQGKNFVNSSMVKSHKLNSILFKLKNYYNELVTYNTQKSNTIKLMNDTISKGEEKIYKMKELQEIDLPEEKIGIKNYNSLKLSKEEIEKNIFSLINQKKNIEDLLQSEDEYNKSLEYMLESEQNKLSQTKRETLQIIEKIENIKRYQKIVNENVTSNEQKEIGYKFLKNKIVKDIKLVQKINASQNNNNEKLTNDIKQKEEEIKNLEERIKKLKEYENIDMQISKNELKEKIKNAKEYEQMRIKNEKRCIEVINSLSLIQKYFYKNDIDINNFDKNKLIQTKEYQQILQLNQEEINSLNKNENLRYINLKNDTKSNELKNADIHSLNSIFSSTFNNKKFFDSNNSIKSNRENMTISATFRNKRKYKEEKGHKNNANKTSSTFYQTAFDFNSFYSNENNSLNELINRFNSIQLKKEEIYNYISNLISKLDFYRNQLNIIHNKEIELENKKSNYSNQVKDIISNNYFNFEELTRNNLKYKEFLEKNEFFINKMKKENQKLKMEKILKKIEQDEEIKKGEIEQSIKEDIDKLNCINDNDTNVKTDNILFKISNDLIINIKNFFFICSDILKDAYSAITGNKKFSTINLEKDVSKNPFIEVLKKLVDFDQNKDIFISNDYKLLIQYIKNLIKYCKENKNILSPEMMQDINSNLFEKFYKPGEVNKKLDNIFINRFITKKNPNYNNIFIHFTILSDQVIENVKEIYNLIQTEEKKSNIRYLRGRESTKTLINNNSESQSQNVENTEKRNSVRKTERKKYTKYNSIKSSKMNSKSYSNIFQELSEDKEDIDKINSSGRKIMNIKNKWRVKSLDKRITDKLYKPFLEKTLYLRQINPNIPGIKQMTSRTCKANHQINKRIGEVNIISKQINIYNNPNIDPNKLCDNTYNSLVKLIYNSTKRNNMMSGKYRYFFAQ